MARKGFPESYDRRALLRFVSEVKAGAAEVRAPFYSHLAYDIVPDAQVTVRRPDVLIVEGLNVLQPPGPGPPARGQRPVRLHDLRRRAHERHRAVVRGAVPEAAARGVLEPALLLPPLREPHRGGGPPAGARDLAFDQRAEPAAEHPPDQVARVAGAAQGPRPRGVERAAAQALRAAAGSERRRCVGAIERRRTARSRQFVRRTRTTSASAAACRSAASCSAASTITRTIGSVPDGRSSTRPESPSSASTAATAAAISASSPQGVVVDAAHVHEHLRVDGHDRGELGERSCPVRAISATRCRPVSTPSPVVANSVMMTCPDCSPPSASSPRPRAPRARSGRRRGSRSRGCRVRPSRGAGRGSTSP